MNLKAGLLLSSFIMTTPVFAGGILDNLNFRTRAYVEAGIRILGSAEHSRSAGGMVEAGDENLCLEKLEKSKERWADSKKGREQLDGVIFLQHGLFRGQVEKMPESFYDLPLNSWDPISAPHLDSQCAKQWKKIDSHVTESANEICRINTYEFGDVSYDIVACSGHDEIYLDLESIQ